jgi:carboxypeptidase T
MADYHRNTIAGSHSTVDSNGNPITVNFRSLKDDFMNLQNSFPGLAALTVIGKSEQGADIQALRVGKDPTLRILMCGCHHAREWISVEIPYLFAEFLLNKYATDPKVQRVLDSTEIWFVPMVNPDGHENTVLTDRLWRKTFPKKQGRVAVDPNRNYAASTWNLKTKGQYSDDPASDSYRGPSPGYAAEVVVMQNLVRQKQFKGVISYHSAGRFVMYPWAGKTTAPTNPKLDEMATLLKKVIDSKGKTYSKMQSNMLYPTLRSIPPAEGLIPGDMVDFVLENSPDAIVITIELEPDINDPRSFVLPPSEIAPTFDLHRASMLSYLNCCLRAFRGWALTTIQTQPTATPLRQQGSGSQVAVYQTNCSETFQSY